MTENNCFQYAFHKVKRMASSNLNQQPISLLQEALVSSRCTATYELIDTSGEPHMRMFTFRASINDDVSATASKSSKKAAKTASALALINLICRLANDSNESTTNNNHNEIVSKIENDETTPEHVALPAALRETRLSQSTSSTCSVPSPLPAKLPTTTSSNANGIASENHVGTLQELGMIRGWGMPQYVEESRGGASHMPTFQTSCTLLQFKTVGEAGNKKAAKKLAALKMLDLISQTELYAGQSLAHEPEQQQLIVSGPPPVTYDTNYVQSDIPIKTEVKDEHAEVACGMSEEVVADVKKNSPLSTSSEMLKLQIIGIYRGADHLQTLRDLCQEQAIELAITRIDDLNDDDDHQALVQLDFSERNMTMFVVCLGAGKDWDLAEANAARNALEYLKLMSRGYKVNLIHF